MNVGAKRGADVETFCLFIGRLIPMGGGVGRYNSPSGSGGRVTVVKSPCLYNLGNQRHESGVWSETPPLAIGPRPPGLRGALVGVPESEERHGHHRREHLPQLVSREGVHLPQRPRHRGPSVSQCDLQTRVLVWIL